MEMRQPFDAYVRLWELLSTNKEKRSPGEAAARLEAYFGSSCGEISDEDDNSVEEMTDSVNTLSRNPIRKRLAIVCLVDEIDYLVTNKQAVVYNLFDWPVRGFIANSKAQLIVLGISNTLNLPERLHPRVSSRLGRERCIFRAYNVDESVNILKCRLAGFVRVFSGTYDHSIFFIAQYIQLFPP
jgi:origin recognition complex subunit 1